MNPKKDILTFIAFFIIELLLFVPFYIADVYAAPSISNIMVTPSYNSANVTWQTDVASTSIVQYDTDSTLDRTYADTESTVTIHSLSVTPLSINTHYYYTVKSCVSSDCSTSTMSDFSTTSAPAPPSVTGLTNGSITTTSIQLMWNASASSFFGYYTIYRNSQPITNISGQSTTTYTDTGLSGATSYKYEISASNTDGVESSKSESVFITTLTPDRTPPVISNLTHSRASSTSVSIKWITSEEANSSVKYGTQNNLNSTQSLSGYSLNHEITITNLVNQTSYYYKVISCDQDGNCAERTTTQGFTMTNIQDLSLQLTAPAISSSATVLVAGTATPSQRIKFYVNDVYKAMISSDRNNGNISYSVPGFSSGNNTLKAVIEDSFGSTLEQTFSVQVDTIIPVLRMTALPSLISSENVLINGSVSETADIKIYVRLTSSDDTTAPGAVTNFHTDRIDQNSLTLAWTNVNDSDFKEYYLYRDGILVATPVSTPYTDDNMVSSGRSYRYEIAAVDTNCNIGQKVVLSSNTTTLSGGVVYNSTPEAETTDCNSGNITPEYTLTDQYPTFSEEIELEQGVNEIKVEAVDAAGNTAQETYTVTYDSEPPEILSTNLDTLSPSYTREVTVTGTTSEESYVCVYINSETETSSYRTNEVNDSGSIELSNSDFCEYTENNTFSIDIELERNPEYAYDAEDSTSQEQSLIVSTGTAWSNNIQVIATDSIGLQSDPEEGEILYSLCGTGGDWTIMVDDLMPSEIVPRHLLEGLAQIGFSVDLTWRGSGDRLAITDVDVSEAYPMGMSSELEDEYDTTWVSRISDTWSEEYDKGYVLIDLKAKDPSTSRNWTTYQKEENLSKHNQGQCFNAPYTDRSYMEQAGCVRIPLTIQIYYEKPVKYRVKGKYEDRKETVMQRECASVEVLIQPRIPPDIVPNAFLESSVEFLNATINFLDTILDPLEKVLKYTMIACFAMWLVLYLKKVSEGFSCMGNNVLDTKTGCKCTAGQDGLTCTKKGSTSNEEDDKCKQCMESKVNTKNYEKIMHWVCDRVMCPSVPSYQKYINDNNKKESSSNCAGKTGTINYAVETGKDTELCKNAPKGLVGKDGPIVAIPECCDEEYMQQWDSGCVIMREIDESKKIAEPETDTNILAKAWRSLSNFKLCGNGFNEERQININGQWFVFEKNSAYNEQEAQKQGKDYNEFKWNVSPGVNQREIVKIDGKVTQDSETIVPDPSQPALTDKSNPNGIDIKKCSEYGKGKYVFGENNGLWPHYKTSVNTETTTQSGNLVFSELTKDEMYKFMGTSQGEQGNANAKNIDGGKEITKTQTDGTAYTYQFNQESGNYEVKSVSQNKNTIQTKEEFDKLKNEDQAKNSYWSISDGQVSVTSTKASEKTTTKTQTKAVPESIVRDACSGFGEDYIAIPPDSLFRSMQCVCISALYAYLKMYRTILGLIKSCFETILITGDGSSGVCQSVLSYYVCDLLYNLFSCFKGSTGFGTHGAEEGNILGFFKGLVGAGAEVQQSVQDRYSGTNMYKAMFVDKKIFHSLCLAFFGADADIDLAALAEQSINIPIKSTVSIFPATRRFVGFNPIDGITNHVYQIGLLIVSGSNDMAYKVSLVCSTDNSCDTKYFDQGKCDCSRSGSEITKDITTQFGGNGLLDQGEIINQEAIIAIDYNTVDAHVRYDKVKVEYDYPNNLGGTKKETFTTNISQVGSEPLASCSFDLLSMAYKCSVFEEPTTACITKEPTIQSSVGTDKSSGWEPLTDNNIYSAIEKYLKISFDARKETSTGDTTRKFFAELSIKDGSNKIFTEQKDITSTESNTYTYETQIKKSWFGSTTSGTYSLFMNPSSATSLGINKIEGGSKDLRLVLISKSATEAKFKVYKGYYTEESGFSQEYGDSGQDCIFTTTSTRQYCADAFITVVFTNIPTSSSASLIADYQIPNQKQSTASQSKTLTYEIKIYRPQSESPTVASTTVAKCSGTAQERTGTFTINSEANPNTPIVKTAAEQKEEATAAGTDTQNPVIKLKINGADKTESIGPIRIDSGKAKIQITVEAYDPDQTDQNNMPFYTGLDTLSVTYIGDENNALVKEENLNGIQFFNNNNKAYEKDISIPSPQNHILYNFKATAKDKQGLSSEEVIISDVYFGTGCDTNSSVCTPLNTCTSFASSGWSHKSEKDSDCTYGICCTKITLNP
jgi:hypothetical protein